MEENKTEHRTLAFTSAQAKVLAAIQQLIKQKLKEKKEGQVVIVTLDELHDRTGLEKGNLSKIISVLKQMSVDKPIIKNTRSGGLQGFGLEGDYFTTSSLTARILIELRNLTIRGKSISLEDFRKHILNAAFFKQAGGTEADLDKRLGWALSPQTGYINQVKAIPGNISANQRIDDEAFYLEKIALKSEDELTE